MDGDLRRYSVPQGDKLAVIFESQDGAPARPRDLVVGPRDPTMPIYRVSGRNEHVDPMTYPLMFPAGTPGWHENLQHSDLFHTACYTRLTPAQSYSHRLMIRDQDRVLPHGAGQLF